MPKESFYSTKLGGEIMKICLLRIIWSFFILVLSALTIEGCTTKLKAKKVEKSVNNIEGQVYYLPKTSYQVQLDRELESCTMEYENEMLAAQEWLREQANIIGGFAPSKVKKIQEKYKDEIKNCSIDYLDKIIEKSKTSEDPNFLQNHYGSSVNIKDLVGIQKTVRAAASQYNQITTDDVLTKTYIDKYISSFLTEEWKEKYAPTPCSIDGLKQFFNDNEASVPERADLQLKLNTAMKAQLSQTALLDPDHIYSIHYNGLSHGIKNTNFSVETYPNGTLKSINVTLKDQTGELVESVIQGGVKISAAASGIPLGLKVQKGVSTSVVPYADWLKNQQKSTSLCSAKTRLRLAQRNLLKTTNDSLAKKNIDKLNEITQQKEIISKLDDELTEKKKKLESLDESDPEHTSLTENIQKHIALIETAKASLDSQEKSLEQIEKDSSKAAEDLDKIRKSLTNTVAIDFIPEPAKWAKRTNGEKIITDAPQISSEIYGADIALRAWLDTDLVSNFCEESLCSNGLPKGAVESLYAEVTLHPSLKNVGSFLQPADGSVIYRQPVRSPLWICKEKPCFDPVNKTMVEPEHILLSSFVDVPQLGVLASLPLFNWPFQNNNLVASFSETGALTKLSYTTNATAVSAAETFAQSADTYLDYRKAKLEEPKETVEANTELLEAKLEELKAQSALNEYLKEVADLEGI